MKAEEPTTEVVTVWGEQVTSPDGRAEGDAPVNLRCREGAIPIEIESEFGHAGACGIGGCGNAAEHMVTLVIVPPHAAPQVAVHPVASPKRVRLDRFAEHDARQRPVIGRVGSGSTEVLVQLAILRHHNSVRMRHLDENFVALVFPETGYIKRYLYQTGKDLGLTEREWRRRRLVDVRAPLICCYYPSSST